ncbi:hypothetical protein D9M71_815680 [compost metagenome]
MATTAISSAGEIGTATMCSARLSPMRMPASQPSATMLASASSMTSSSWSLGWRVQNSCRWGSSRVLAATREVFTRTSPEGSSRMSCMERTVRSTAINAGYHTS